MEKNQDKTLWFKKIFTISGIVFIIFVIVGYIVSDIETPKYEILHSEHNIEIRQYQPMIVAEVDVKGERKDAISDGFRLLADYIFGNNISKHDIAMTAPVQQQFNGDSWQVSFVMPSKYTIKTLPQPVNKLVKLNQVPAKKFVVIRFSGTNSDDNIKKNKSALLQYIKNKNISVIGAPKSAFYNPPWTLPVMRRNEIMMEMQASAE